MPRDYGTLPTRNGNGNGASQGIDERESLLPHTYDSERSSWRARVHAKLQEDINVEDSGPGLLCQCMIAGAADAAAYSQTLTWAAFMVRRVWNRCKAMHMLTRLVTHAHPR